MNKFTITTTENTTEMNENMPQLTYIGSENQEQSETKRNMQTPKESKGISLKISPSLSQMLMQCTKTNTPLKNNLARIDNYVPRSENKFSAQSNLMGNKSLKTEQRCQKLEKTMQGIQQLILNQKARTGQITKNSECVSVKKSCQGVAQFNCDAQKQQNLHKLLALASLINKRPDDNSKMYITKQLSSKNSLFEKQEGSNSLLKATIQGSQVKTSGGNVPVNSKFGFQNFTAQNSFMKQSPLFGQNILKPIFERKTQDNTQNLLNSTPKLNKANSICKTYPTSAEVSDCKASGEMKARNSNFSIACFKNISLNIGGQKQSESSEEVSQTNLNLDHQQSAFKKIQPQRSFTDKIISHTPREVQSGDDTSPVTVQSPGRSDNSAIVSPVKVENSLEKQKSLQLKQLNLSQLQLLLKDFSTSSMGCSHLKGNNQRSDFNESPMLINNSIKASPDQFNFKLPKIKQNSKKANLINEQVTKQFKSTHQLAAGYDEKENFCPSQLLGKRKRKTERELRILRTELRKNVMWTRESIKQMRKLYEEDFSMSEQQIYKWWWDQTRKRTKKNDSKKGQKQNEELENGEEQTNEDDELLISFQDEFGGYSSRLRLNGGLQTVAKEQKLGEDAENVDLCALLGIDVEGIAIRLALGLDQDSDDESVNAAVGNNTDIKKLNTAVTLNSGIQKSSNHSIAIAEALSPGLSNANEEDGQLNRNNFVQNKMMIDELMNGIDYTTRKNSFATEKHQPERRVAHQNEIGETTTRHVSFSTQESQ